MNNRITLDVSGQLFTVLPEILENGPPSRLTRMYKDGLSMYKDGLSMSKSDCILINRPPECFRAILAFYQTGELHIPMTSCPGAFMSELEYWEILPERVSACCYNRLLSFLDEQKILTEFKESLQPIVTPSHRCFETARANLWAIVDYSESTLVGKIYFIVSIFMVLLSIFVLAFSTDPSFQRTMTNCERLEYMASSNMDGYNIVKPYLEHSCEDSLPPLNSSLPHESKNNSELFNLLEENPEKTERKFLFYLFYFFYEELLQTNHSARTVDESIDIQSENESMELISENEDDLNTDSDYSEQSLFRNDSVSAEANVTKTDVPSSPKHYHPKRLEPSNVTDPVDVAPIALLTDIRLIKIPNLTVKIYILVMLESLTTIYFTVDVILRIVSCPSIKHYFLTVINFTDTLSLVCTYAYAILFYLYPHLRYGSWIDYLSYMQMLRTVRLFRIVSNVRAGQVLAYSIRENIKDISILVLFLLAGMCAFSTFFYVAENKSNVQSVLEAWYWAIITMTTVGYGDIQPQTHVGKLVACLCAVTGIILLAITVPVFTNHFLVLYQHAESVNGLEKIYRQKLKAKGRVQVKTEK